ncbi:MAG: B12-binding domain-containing radical SAM protein [Phycisphaerae bacterium]|nr:B12-binding domain-containing radical SAM protein [Phycisphaerae bacterium]
MNKSTLKPAIILVADRTLSANYKILFEGMFGTMQTTQVPELAMRTLVAPPMPYDKSTGRAWAAPLGLRRVETALLNECALGPDDVVCTTPEGLGSLLGPWVKLVMVSSSDPLGIGMSNTTTANFWDGELYTKFWTNRMMMQLRTAKEKSGNNFKIIAGGAGAWQWVHLKEDAIAQGIDIIFEGYFEKSGPKLVTNLLNNSPLPQPPWHITGDYCPVTQIKPNYNPSMLGTVELTRGCGKGCNFCIMANQKMEHFPVDTILTDIQTNLTAGINTVVSTSEDFFRYGGQGSKPDFNKLCHLLTEIRKFDELSFIQIDHGNVSSIYQFSESELKEIRRLLSWREKIDYLWVNMGIESANGHLVQANSPGKIAPFDPDNWEQIVMETVDRMIAAGFFPIISLILGLPGETPEDVKMTLEMVKQLEKKRAVIFPIFYEPIEPDKILTNHRFSISRMTLDHLELYTRCYEINFKRVPPMFWDNQRAAGVSWFKRALTRSLGKTEVHSWRKAFKRIKKQKSG